MNIPGITFGAPKKVEEIKKVEKIIEDRTTVVDETESHRSVIMNLTEDTILDYLSTNKPIDMYDEMMIDNHTIIKMSDTAIMVQSHETKEQTFYCYREDTWINRFNSKDKIAIKNT